MPIDPPGPDTRVYQPRELNREVRVHLEAGFPRLWLSGEISNLARPGSGHWYFTVKDDRAQVRCAMFKSQARQAGLDPANGDQVLVRGRLSLYEPRGDYQLIADALLPAGTGALQAAFEALKKKLDGEGLFAEELKRPLPDYPQRIAVVTSPTGAAVRDVVRTLALRWPAARVRIYPAVVQGESAPDSVMRALNAAGRDGFGQVVLLVRGGGSLEDLWAFNDESLARAIHALEIPVVTGIGHETDFTIADLVADHRAATPTAAAQAATPDGPALATQVRRQIRRLLRAMEVRLQQSDQRLDGLARRLAGRHPARRLDEQRRYLADLDRRLGAATRRAVDARERELASLARRLRARHPARQVVLAGERLAERRARLQRAMARTIDQSGQRLAATVRALQAVSPLAVLGRGYGLVRDADGQVLSRPQDFATDQEIHTRIRDFEVDSRVLRLRRDQESSGGS